MKATCTICLEILEFSMNNDLATTRCGHVFHRTCVLEWLTRPDPSCPQCREITTGNSILRLFFEASPDESQIEDQQKVDALTSVEREQLNDCLEKIKTLEKTITALTVEKTDVKRQRDLAINNAAFLNTRIDAQTAQMREKDDLIRNNNQRITDLEDQVQQLEVMNASAVESVEDSNKRLNAMQEELECMDKQMLSASAQEEQSRQEITNLKIQLESLIVPDMPGLKPTYKGDDAAARMPIGVVGKSESSTSTDWRANLDSSSTSTSNNEETPTIRRSNRTLMNSDNDSSVDSVDMAFREGFRKRKLEKANDPSTSNKGLAGKKPTTRQTVRSKGKTTAVDAGKKTATTTNKTSTSTGNVSGPSTSKNKLLALQALDFSDSDTSF